MTHSFQPAWRSAVAAACLATLAACATTEANHAWPSTVIGIDKMTPTGSLLVPIRMPKEEKKPHGTVVVRIHVDSTGAAQYAEVYQSSGNRHVDAAGVLAGKQAKFKPHLENGQPVPVMVVAPMTF